MIDNNIYEWLNNNEQSSTTSHNNSNTTTTLIECILIISINGILIEHQSLIDYCNNVVLKAVNSYNINDHMIINNSKSVNRIKNNDSDNNHENSSPSTTYCGLSAQQFQTIFNNIKNINDNSTTTTTTLDENINSKKYERSDEYISSSSNKIKFNSSITIISENNKLILNKQQHQHQQYNNNTTMKSSSHNISSSRKKIKSCSNCNGGGNGNKEIRDINIIFFSVWRNIVIRNEILFHTRLYNIHFGREITLYSNELSTYKYRGYLDKLALFEKEGFDRTDGIYQIKFGLIPYGVSTLELCSEYQFTLEYNSIPGSVTNVVFYNDISNQIFVKGILPDSITSLEFIDGNKLTQSLSSSWLPHSLKSLTLGYLFQQSIELNELPKSLTELILPQDYEGTIVAATEGFDAIKSLNYKFDSNKNENKLTCKSIPESTTCLKFDDYFNQPIKSGDIPHNVSFIKLPFYFNNDIKSLPSSLKSLEFGYSFNQPINPNVLPSNLTYIDMVGFNQPLTPNLFPYSITSIKMSSFNQPLPAGYFYNYTNLKSLALCNFYNKVIPDQTLPPSITSLNVGKSFNNGYINALPSSLSTFTITIESTMKNPLPLSIISLKLLSYSPIPSGLLPCNLKELYIADHEFNQHLSFESFEQGILPRSLHSIYINYHNPNYINSLDTHFLYKYIKFVN